MQIELFLGDALTGRSLGTVDDVDLARGRNSLEVSGSGMHVIWNKIPDPHQRGVGNVEFSLVADDVEYQACRIVGMGAVMRISFMRTRDA